MTTRISELKLAMRSAVSAFRLDEAELAFQELTDQCGVDPDSDDMLHSRVTIGIFNGRLRDMLQMLNYLGDDNAVAVGLKVVCLRLLDDPSWEGLATQIEENSSNDAIRESMQQLLEAR